MPSQPWAVTWRKALVSAPRLVPDAALRFLSPEGPQPIVIKLPSRGQHLIPVYVFVPPILDSSQSDVPNLPVLVDFHGGGFVLGTPQEQASFCAKLCRELRCVAVSVDYRLGPYAQFPAALEDAEDVINAILEPTEPGHVALRSSINEYLTKNKRAAVQLDHNRIALSGFSSGGNLALNLVMNMNSSATQLTEAWPCPFPSDYPSNIPVLMYYAAIDLRQLPSEREVVAGFHDAPKSFIAQLELEQHLMPTYLPRDKITHSRASPALAEVRDQGLHSQARCLLLVAEKDSLTLQNEVWMRKASAEGRGNHVFIQKYMGVPHGWTQFPDSWLDANALTTKYEAFDRGVEFVRGYWKPQVVGTT